jgi:hypothetical protein
MAVNYQNSHSRQLNIRVRCLSPGRGNQSTFIIPSLRVLHLNPFDPGRFGFLMLWLCERLVQAIVITSRARDAE